ncbi:polysaccharide pyruvyl transferase family protein [Clostridium butyricum]|uniref:polysaccharide pyruvyl transferase family protein n=1 Tax=Clostridium butyricum TaxID=1492 RepID=UPI002ABE3115|nr:polysaccharide pyruvyl transferase family protein [Clostridium butyricum]
MCKLKIGIITFHAAENFGSALQAFALEKVLMKNNYIPEIIDFILESDMKQYRLFRRHLYKHRPKAFLGDLIYYSRNLKRRYNFKSFKNKHLQVSSKQFYSGKDDLRGLNSEYDAFVCGSDQIWNLNCTNGFVSEYFLTFVDSSKKKISYAPSMPTKVSSKYYGDLKTSIENLNSISVREKQTIGYLQDTVGVKTEIVQVVDPTLLIDSNSYVENFGIKKKNEKYIFVYILGDSEINKSIIDMANQTSNQTGMKIKYVFIRSIKEFKKAEYLLGCGPVEFLDAIYNASYVITDSFHATVFSVHFHVPFCVFPRKGSESRMNELLGAIDMTENIYLPHSMEWMKYQSDENTNTKVKQMAEKSLKFLLESLE